jgi:DNA-binding FadR family transcriptional regulator
MKRASGNPLDPQAAARQGLKYPKVARNDYLYDNWIMKQKPHRHRKRMVKLHLTLAQGIGEDILKGTYPPGTLLPNEAEWGRRYGASRTAVREAIKTLVGKGLISTKPKIGSRVELRDRWNLLDRDVLAWHCAAMDKKALLLSIQEVRRVLEPAIAALAARKRTAEQLAQISEALDGMRKARSAKAVVEPDIRFHLSLIAAANNELLLPFGSILEAALANIFDYTSVNNPKRGPAIALHENILKAVAHGNPDAARKAAEMLLGNTDSILARR